MPLSDAARSVWAKSIDSEGGWLPLWQHMDDAADVAGGLFDDWLAPNVVGLIAEEFGGDLDAARAAVTFLAGIHDLGKATPAFAVQDPLLAQRMRDLGLYMRMSRAELPDRHLAPHALASHKLLICWLVGQGWPKGAARTWGVVLGGHHGVSPNADAERQSPVHDSDIYGSGLWMQVQGELVERMAVRTGAAPRLSQWRELSLSPRFQVLATAIVIVSDWIASNSELLPFHRDQLPEVADQTSRVTRALARLRLPTPWHPDPGSGDVAALFAARFSLPVGAKPHPVQETVCEVAWAMPRPGLLIVEAPMGEGKTEAALAAAEILAARWGAGGLFVALPTQATSDAMFDRVVNWLDAMGAGDRQVAGSITLAHGKARFNRLFQGMVQAGRPGEIGRDECEDGSKIPHAVVADSWLSGRKKAQLANFTVCTIDQLLFAGLKARHVMLRHLGLAGKVVILDEIHAYDAYMNSYLTAVLTWLGAYRVPVIALSATLPGDRRRELIEAYQRGHQGPPKVQGEQGIALDGDIGYPAVTWTEDATVNTRVAGASGRSTSVMVETFAAGLDDLDALSAVLRDALSEGGTALVVRNTVTRVLETADRLEREFPGEVTVAHARFITADRMRKDSELLDSFGPPGRAVCRPLRHIVVASQVVEQSLDVDFDLLITDLAPIDLVLQRMGRLHRHQRGDQQSDRPPKVRSARVYVTGADFTQSPPELEPMAARHVYQAYPLLRAAAVLRGRLGGTIALPDDIAPLVQRAYGPDDIEPADWKDATEQARNRWRDRTERREEKARDFQITRPGRNGKAIVGWLAAGVGESDDEAQGQGQVRDGAPTLEAILVHADDAGQWHTPAWLSDGAGGLPIPREKVPSDDLANVIASCALRLPLTFSNADAEDELWSATPPAWEQSPTLYRLPALVVSDDGWGQLNQQKVRYTPERGLEMVDDA